MGCISLFLVVYYLSSYSEGLLKYLFVFPCSPFKFGYGSLKMPGMLWSDIIDRFGSASLSGPEKRADSANWFRRCQTYVTAWEVVVRLKLVHIFFCF